MILNELKPWKALNKAHHIIAYPMKNNLTCLFLALTLFIRSNGQDSVMFTDFSEIVNGLEYSMIAVKGGTFRMGETPSATGIIGMSYATRFPDVSSRTISVSDFYIGKYEVTQEQWRQVMGSNPSGLAFKGCDSCPVESVSWFDVQEFINKLNHLTGRTFRLPTEAEWEYAAVGGEHRQTKKILGQSYSGSNKIGDVAWYQDNSNGRVHPVGLKKPNELGSYDMSGNVWEWCSDWYGRYRGNNLIDPQGPEKGKEKVIRGGSYINYEMLVVWARQSHIPTRRVLNVGFRLAMSNDN
jgi:formylglycine-generating enzyme